MNYIPAFVFIVMGLTCHAQDTVKIAVTLNPEQQAELDYNNGLEALNKNSPALAQDLFSKCLVVKSTFDKAYANRAIANTKLGKYNEAVSDINVAISLSPKNPGFYFNKSLIFFSQNKKDSQDLALDKCLALDGTHPEAAYYKGLLCYERKEFDRAVGYYGVAIENKPGFVFAYNDRGSAKRARGDFEGAISDYKTALGLDSSLVFIYNNLGSVYRESKNYEKAVDVFSHAFKINSKYIMALLNRGCSYFDMGNYKAAQADFEEALFIEPSCSFAYNNLASIAIKSKEYKRAKDLATRAIELDPKNGPAFYNRGIASQMLREEEACCSDWKKAYQLGVEGAKIFISATCKE